MNRDHESIYTNDLESTNETQTTASVVLVVGKPEFMRFKHFPE